MFHPCQLAPNRTCSPSTPAEQNLRLEIVNFSLGFTVVGDRLGRGCVGGSLIMFELEPGSALDDK